MADALSLGVTYSSVKGRVLPSPMEHAPSSLLAALFFHSPCAAFALLQRRVGCYSAAHPSLQQSEGLKHPKDTAIRPVSSAARLPMWGSLRLYYLRMEAQQHDRVDSGSLGKAQEGIQRPWWRRIFGG